MKDPKPRFVYSKSTEAKNKTMEYIAKKSVFIEPQE